MNSSEQLLLGFSAREDADFESFYTPKQLKMVVSTLKNLVDQGENDIVYLSGVEGVGKSHLLQAICNYAFLGGRNAMYLPLHELAPYEPSDIFDNTDNAHILAIDGLDAIAGNPVWEEALFHLFNQRLHVQLPIVFSANEPASQLPVQLMDLKSRLSSCLGFQLRLLNDEEKTGFIQFIAKQRGMIINDACASFIILRSGRSLSDLLDILRKLDTASMAAGRKITIPFIKEAFGW